jgi:hypothetical protein
MIFSNPQLPVAMQSGKKLSNSPCPLFTKERVILFQDISIREPNPFLKWAIKEI